MAGYFGEYFHRHWGFPLVLNTHRLIGLPYPVFYGTLFYPLAGLASSFIGANLALRLIIVGILCLQSVEVTKVVRLLSRDHWIGWGISALSVFAAYPLTNIYTRSAITEALAVSLLVSACCIWLRVSWAAAGWKTASLAWLLFALAAGTHPITAMLGVMAFGAVLAAGFLFSSDRPRLLKYILWNGLAFLAVLAPWAYAVGLFHDGFSFAAATRVQMFSGIDDWWVRLMPIPFDARTLHQPLHQVSTPYLDAQWNAGMAILAAFLMFQAIRGLRRGTTRRKELIAAGCCLSLAVAILSLSVNRQYLDLLPRFMVLIQFAYRLVSYADLALFFTVLFLLAALRDVRDQIRRSSLICLAACIALMTAGVAIKLSHAAAIETREVVPGSEFSGDRQFLILLPPHFYGTDAYAVDWGFAGPITGQLPPIFLKAGGKENFGLVDSLPVAPFQGSTVETNVQAFPWNRFSLADVPVPSSRISTILGHRLALSIPPGASLLNYNFLPDAIYTGLRHLSWIILCGWIGALCLYPKRRALKITGRS
jgi:4-amino-4-deoxy-L-arabinose transferase and related glycosyltransferases of PMT family